MSHKKQTKLYGCAPDDQLSLSNPVSRAYVLLPLGFIDLVRRDTASRIITDGRGADLSAKNYYSAGRKNVLPFRATIIVLVFERSWRSLWRTSALSWII